MFNNRDISSMANFLTNSVPGWVQALNGIRSFHNNRWFNIFPNLLLLLDLEFTDSILTLSWHCEMVTTAQEDITALIVRMGKNLVLPQDKKPTVTLKKNMKAVKVIRWFNSAVGKVFCSEEFMPVNIQEDAKHTWRLINEVVVEKYKNCRNTFIFKFGCSEDLNMVLENGPWLIRGALVVLVEMPELGFRPGYPRLDRGLFWVKFKGVPEEYFSKSALIEIAKPVGMLINIGRPLSSYRDGEDVRGWVSIHLKTKLPLENDFGEEETDNKITISYGYELLPRNFCEICRVLDHNENKCPKNHNHRDDLMNEEGITHYQLLVKGADNLILDTNGLTNNVEEKDEHNVIDSGDLRQVQGIAQQGGRSAMIDDNTSNSKGSETGEGETVIKELVTSQCLTNDASNKAKGKQHVSIFPSTDLSYNNHLRNSYMFAQVSSSSATLQISPADTLILSPSPTTSEANTNTNSENYLPAVSSPTITNNLPSPSFPPGFPHPYIQNHLEPQFQHETIPPNNLPPIHAYQWMNTTQVALSNSSGNDQIVPNLEHNDVRGQLTHESLPGSKRKAHKPPTIPAKKGRKFKPLPIKKRLLPMELGSGSESQQDTTDIMNHMNQFCTPIVNIEDTTVYGSYEPLPISRLGDLELPDFSSLVNPERSSLYGAENTDSSTREVANQTQEFVKEQELNQHKA